MSHWIVRRFGPNPAVADAAGAGTVLLIVVVTWLWIVLPLQRKADAIEVVAQQNRSLVAQATPLKKRLSELSAEFAAVEDRIDQLNQRIPDEPRTAEFLAHVTQLARDSEVEIRSFQPARAEHHEQYSSVAVQLTAIARYDALCRFLGGLETLPRLSHIRTFELSGMEQDRRRLQLDMEARIFFTPDQNTTSQGRQSP